MLWKLFVSCKHAMTENFMCHTLSCPYKISHSTTTAVVYHKHVPCCEGLLPKMNTLKFNKDFLFLPFIFALIFHSTSNIAGFDGL